MKALGKIAGDKHNITTKSSLDKVEKEEEKAL
jgi:hypothetical protein